MQAIRTYVRDVDPEQLRSDMGAGATGIGQVISDVWLPGMEIPPGFDPHWRGIGRIGNLDTWR